MAAGAGKRLPLLRLGRDIVLALLLGAVLAGVERPKGTADLTPESLVESVVESSRPLAEASATVTIKGVGLGMTRSQVERILKLEFGGDYLVQESRASRADVGYGQPPSTVWVYYDSEGRTTLVSGHSLEILGQELMNGPAEESVVLARLGPPDSRAEYGSPMCGGREERLRYSSLKVDIMLRGAAHPYRLDAGL